VLTTWTSLAVWLLPACLVGLAILGGALWTLRRQRNCPSCRTPMVPLATPGTDAPEGGPGAVPSYEVLVCESCSNAATLVHGHQSRFAYCPSCLNRSLRAPCMRQDDGSVKIEEACELCGYRDTRVIGAPPIAGPEPVMGQVIPFPMHRVRSSEGDKVEDG